MSSSNVINEIDVSQSTNLPGSPQRNLPWTMDNNTLVAADDESWYIWIGLSVVAAVIVCAQALVEDSAVGTERFVVHSSAWLAMRHTRTHHEKQLHTTTTTTRRRPSLVRCLVLTGLFGLILGEVAVAATSSSGSFVRLGRWEVPNNRPYGSPLSKTLQETIQQQQPATPLLQFLQDAMQETKTKQETMDPTESEILEALTRPLIPKGIWDHVKGDEFMNHPELAEQLAITGIQMATMDDDTFQIEWRGHTPGIETDIRAGGIHYWRGTIRNAQNSIYGAELKLIKTRSIVPYTATEFVNLMMDSERVQSYNPWSLGRTDCWKRSDTTKIVQNRVQPPLGAKQVVSTTLLHAQSVPDTDQHWVIVSRAVPGFDDETAGRSEILLGVNYLQPYGDHQCLLTCINHVYSAAVPTMLAERLGVKSAIQFVKDLRSLKKKEQESAVVGR